MRSRETAEEHCAKDEHTRGGLSNETVERFVEVHPLTPQDWKFWCPVFCSRRGNFQSSREERRGEEEWRAESRGEERGDPRRGEARRGERRSEERASERRGGAWRGERRSEERASERRGGAGRGGLPEPTLRLSESAAVRASEARRGGLPVNPEPSESAIARHARPGGRRRRVGPIGPRQPGTRPRAVRVGDCAPGLGTLGPAAGVSHGADASAQSGRRSASTRPFSDP